MLDKEAWSVVRFLVHPKQNSVFSGFGVRPQHRTF